MQPTILWVVSTGLVAVFEPGFCFVMQRFTGVATFNDFARQSITSCGPKSGAEGTYGAAAGDISPDISGGACSGSINMGHCNGNSPVHGYLPPSCPKGNCGACYRVTNKGGHNRSKIGGIGNSIIVQIIDSCPSTHPSNFCKTQLPENERCGSKVTNQLDIDQSAYRTLTGQHSGYGPNLVIDIEHVACGACP